MPKLKVPSVVKPAKKQLDLYQLKRWTLHVNKSSVTESNRTPSSMEASSLLSPKKQNGLKPTPKSFLDTFGASDDEVRHLSSSLPPTSLTHTMQADLDLPFFGYSLEVVLEEYRALAKSYAVSTPDKPAEEGLRSQRSTRPRKSKVYLVAGIN